MKYIKQLDSIRAIAVLLVMITHWLPANNILNRNPNGLMGVDIFFVLSGFLITNILFDNRNKALLTNTPKSALIKNFYFRRTLRIFPIYYLTLFGLYFFRNDLDLDLSSSFVYYLTYTSNFYFFKIQTWPGMLSHLWSLAVEEQFYLVWPWLILFAPKKYFLPIIYSFILIGIASQYYLVHVNMGRVLTNSCLDAFGIGALLSYQICFNPNKLRSFYSLLSILAIVSGALYILGLVQNDWPIVPYNTLVSLMTVWVLAYIYLNQKTGNLKFKFILNNRILIFLGKISYGIYLYHNLIPTALNSKIINKYFNPLLPDILYKRYWGQLFLIENLILVVVISWLSYVLIEKRFLALKRFYEYQPEHNAKKKQQLQNIT